MTELCPGSGRKDCGRAARRDGYCGLHHPDRLEEMRSHGLRCRPLNDGELAQLRAVMARRAMMEALEREFWRLHRARSRHLRA